MTVPVHTGCCSLKDHRGKYNFFFWRSEYVLLHFTRSTNVRAITRNGIPTLRTRRTADDQWGVRLCAPRCVRRDALSSSNRPVAGGGVQNVTF